jgi:hypothetical protein
LIRFCSSVIRASSHELFAQDAPDLAEILEVLLAVLDLDGVARPESFRAIASPPLVARAVAGVPAIVDARFGKGNPSLGERIDPKAVLRCPI